MGLLVVAPVASLIPAAIFDLGAESQVRFSLFPLALTLYDPFIWTCLWNSVVVALAITTFSLLAGVGLAHLVARRRFWGRPLFCAFVLGLAVVPPAFLALGLRGLYGHTGPWLGRALNSALHDSESGGSLTWSWLVWIWAASIQGTALVLLSTASTLDRLNPDWEEAARLTGARPSRIWLRLTWPMLRPSVTAALNLVFLMNVADPGAPLLLGLRRSLGSQIVAVSMRPDPFPRIAGIGLMILVLTIAWRSLMRRWRERSWTGQASERNSLSRPHGAVELAWPWSVPTQLLLFLWTALAWLPLAGLLKLALATSHTLAEPNRSGGPGIVELARRLTEEHAPGLLANSLSLGLPVAGLCWLLGWWVPRREVLPLARRCWGRMAQLAQSVPPLVMGVGVLALAHVADLSARMFQTGLGWTVPAHGLEMVARLLDPYGSPSILLFLGVCLAYLPLKSGARGGALEPSVGAARRVEQALVAGAHGNRARRLGLREGSAQMLRRILWSTLAAASVSPAILLCPTIDRGPVGPGVVILANRSEEARSEAAALALAAIAASWISLACALAGRNRGRVLSLELTDLA
jgi:ABC-type Fe3+ transport system permease subunit